MPLLLAALHYNATQLAAACRYWLAMELPQARLDPQWRDVSAADQQGAEAEWARVCEARAELRQLAAQLALLPCLLRQSGVS